MALSFERALAFDQLISEQVLTVSRMHVTTLCFLPIIVCSSFGLILVLF